MKGTAAFVLMAMGLLAVAQAARELKQLGSSATPSTASSSLFNDPTAANPDPNTGVFNSPSTPRAGAASANTASSASPSHNRHVTCSQLLDTYTQCVNDAQSNPVFSQQVAADEVKACQDAMAPACQQGCCPY